MKKITRKLLTLIIIITTMLGSLAVSASAAWPSYGSGRPIYAYTISNGKVTTYDSSHRKESGHYTEKDDEIYILSVSSGWVKFTYPTSSKRRTAYAPVGTFFASDAPQEKISSRKSAATYRRPDLSQKAGSIDAGDTVYKMGTNGSSVQVLYNVGSVSSPTAYRCAWVSKQTYDEMKGKKTARSASAYNNAINGLRVESNYLPSNGNTYCNLFAMAVMKAYNVEFPSGLANSIYTSLSNGSCSWRSCSAKEAQTRANNGFPTVVCYYNPKGHGHIAVVRPEGNGYKYSSAKGPVVANAGAHNYNYANVSTCFGSRTVRYFTHD